MYLLYILPFRVARYLADGRDFLVLRLEHNAALVILVEGDYPGSQLGSDCSVLGI